MIDLLLCAASLFGAAVLWKLWRKTGNAFAAYTMLTMLAFFGFALGKSSLCGMNNLFSFCTWVVSKTLSIGIPVAVLVTFFVGYVIMPFWIKRKHGIARLRNPLLRHAKKAALLVSDQAHPFAFSIKRNIMISVGMFELLSKKELDAVILHELGHIRRNASLRKVGASLIRHMFPQAFSAVVNQEEALADAFAIQIQKTDRFLKSARRKIDNYESHAARLPHY